MHKKNKLINIFSFLSVLSVIFFSYIPLIPLLRTIGITKNQGFLLCIVFVSTIMLFFFFSKKGIMSYNRIKFFFLYILFAIYSTLISYPLSNNFYYRNETLLIILFLNPLFIIIGLISSQYKEKIFKVLFSLVFYYVVFISFLFISGSLSITGDSFMTVFSYLDKTSYQNINMYLALNLILIKNIKLNSKLFNAVKITIIFFIFYLMLLIGGRGSILAISAIYLLDILNEILNRKTIIIYTVIFGLFFLCIVFLDFQAYLLDIDLLGINRFLTYNYEASDRVYFYLQSGSILFSDFKTFLFGSGLSMFPIEAGLSNPSTYPHNFLLELLCEYGIIGTSLFLFPIVNILNYRKKKIGSYFGVGYERIAFSIFLLFGILSCFSGSLRTSWMFIYFTFLLYPSQGPNK